MENHHAIIIGKPSINGSFSMAMLVITRGYMIYVLDQLACWYRKIIFDLRVCHTTEKFMPRNWGKVQQTIIGCPGHHGLRRKNLQRETQRHRHDAQVLHREVQIGRECLADGTGMYWASRSKLRNTFSRLIFHGNSTVPLPDFQVHISTSHKVEKIWETCGTMWIQI